MNPDRLAELEDERRFLLRSLRDLDAELVAGDVDHDDYETLRDGYTSGRPTCCGRSRRAGTRCRRRGPRGGRDGLAVAARRRRGGTRRRLGRRPLVGPAARRRRRRRGGRGRRRGRRARRGQGVDLRRPGRCPGAVRPVLDERPEHPEALAYSGFLLFDASSSAGAELRRTAVDAAQEPSSTAPSRPMPPYADPHCFLAVIAADAGDDAKPPAPSASPASPSTRPPSYVSSSPGRSRSETVRRSGRWRLDRGGGDAAVAIGRVEHPHRRLAPVGRRRSRVPRRTSADQIRDTSPWSSARRRHRPCDQLERRLERRRLPQAIVADHLESEDLAERIERLARTARTDSTHRPVDPLAASRSASAADWRPRLRRAAAPGRHRPTCAGCPPWRGGRRRCSSPSAGDFTRQPPMPIAQAADDERPRGGGRGRDHRLGDEHRHRSSKKSAESQQVGAGRPELRAEGDGDEHDRGQPVEHPPHPDQRAVAVGAPPIVAGGTSGSAAFHDSWS